MEIEGQEKTPFWLVIPLCTLAAWIAGNMPVWGVECSGAYTVAREDRWTLLLPMARLSVLAIVARLIRRFGDSDDASGEAWRVLTAGCALYLLGEFFSWPLAIVFREYFTYLPKPFPRRWHSHTFPLEFLPAGIAFLAWGTFLLFHARQRTWHSLLRPLLRHLGAAIGILLAFLLLMGFRVVFWPRF